MKKTLIKILTPVVVVGVGIGIYALLHAAKPEPEKKDEPPRALSVFVQPVNRSDIPLKVITQGEVRARTDVDIVAQVAGRIVKVSPEFIEGGVIEPDVPLVIIESTDYEFELKRSSAVVAEAEVRLQQALADADVARKQLRDTKDPSPLALKKPQVAEARAGLMASEAVLSLAETNLDRTRITLPFHGRVISTLVDIGQYVSPGTRIGRAFGNDVVEIRLPLNDTQLASLGLPIGYIAPKGGALAVEITATVAGKEQKWQGELTRLDAAIDPSSRLLYGIAEVNNPYGDGASQYGMPLAVGLFVTAEVSGRELRDAYIIPRHALRAGNQVYVVNDKGRLEIRAVDVTYSSSEEAVIGMGLAPGDKVVVSSIRNPIEGMQLEALPYGLDSSAVAKDGHRPVKKSEHIQTAGG
ncbi:MAG: efflux RND transporter periplasmic adaptor subunit [Gammaproteobacteria bacterium]|nr:efflux RND transporter periplasmic adaptor subunit [Gammaproteobacteria bacterium]MBT4493541.1 efflux RND transporter periplasmic adaptor subunit [Gammaproteobacteria bacterium]MBT7370991.1 efflux RND transporter periplasmic adaptor subunit [Gammaproteobacteria bacterium]